MATVLNPPPALSKLDARLEEDLGKATGRIRLNDVLTGGLALAVLTLSYAAAAVLLDRWLELPEWVRQAMLGGFLLVFAGVGYFALVRPLRRRVNPRFAARKVEATVPDAKNALINWVDLREKELPDGVRLAVRAKAAEGVAEADVNKAVESRRVVWLAAAAGLLLAVLAALFVIFKPAPFLSLVSRTFNPFTVTRIATRTELTIQEPEEGDATVTTGDHVTVRVYVGGSVPDPDGPARMRLRVRYNPAVPEYDELPLDPGGSAREWVLRVPQAVVQNGFWYKVAGGDAETPEYRVTVRSRPLFKEVEARYVYPAYTRLKPEVAHEWSLWAYPGTEVTLTAKTNRQVKEGNLYVAGQEPVRGLVVGESRDSLQFRLKMPRESGTYRLDFLSADGERSDPTPAYPLRVETDKKPWVTITSPTEDEGTLPANGLLKVDGTLEDDIGLASAALGMRLVDGDLKVELPPKPYRDGRSFRRESDGTFPTKMDYKDSVQLGSLTYKDGQRATLKESMTLEYWLEATDNCTEPRPNVGKSAGKRVRIAPPEKEPEKQQQQKQAQQQRGTEEQQHRQQQDQQLQSEKRDPPPQLRPEEKQNPDQQNQNGGESTKSGEQGGQPPKPNTGDPKQNENPNPEPKGGNTGENPPKSTDPQKGAAEPPGKPNDPSGRPPEMGTAPPNPPDKQPMGNPGGTTVPTGNTNPPPDKGTPSQDPQDTQQPGGTPPPQGDPKNAEKQAQDVRNAIDQHNRQPGGARNQDPAESKPAEAPADKKPAGHPPSSGQSEPKAGQPTDSQGQPAGGPSAESKPAGNLEQPKPTDTKPEPKPADGNPQLQPNRPASPGGGATGTTPKHPPVAGNESAQEKEQPGAQGGDPAQPKEPPAGGGTGEKRSSDVKPTDPSAARGPEASPQQKANPEEPQKGTPAAETKPKPEATRGQERPSGGASTGQQSPDERPADSKGAKPVDPAARKQPPSGGEPNQAQPAGEKPQPGEGADPKDPRKSPSDAKPEGAKPQPGSAGTDPKTPPAAGQPRPDDKAAEKSAQPMGEKDPKNQGGSGGKPKVDPKELEQAARDLASGDPEKQQAARDKLDKMIGKDAREQAERETKQLAEDLKSDDPAKRQAAEQKLKDFAEQAKRQGGGQGEKKVDPKEIEHAAQDLASGDPQKQQAARDKLDKIMGKDARVQAERDAKQLANDLKSTDPDKRKAAEQKIKNLARQAEQHAGQGGERVPMSEEEKRKLAEMAKDLASDDKAKREAAEKEFDKAIGKERREQLQQIAKDAQSGDPKKQEAARQRLEEMMKNAAEGAQGHQMSPEELQKWAEKAKDLNSTDQGKRETAEKEFDEKFGKEAREQFQKDMQDPKKVEEARKKFEDMANKFNKDFRIGGQGSRGQEGSLHQDDPKNRLKTAELQLQQFEKNRHNSELQKQLGWTQQEYDRFLAEQQKRIAQMRDEVAKRELQGTEPQPTGPATLKVGEGSGGRKLETRPDGTAGTVSGSGPGTAPAGYTDAQRKFAEEAAKLRKGQDEK
jgi:hypothetical protein